MRKASRQRRFLVPFALLAIGLATVSAQGQSPPDYRAGSLPDAEPRPIYATDASDSWNRIFNALFTRTVRFRLSGEFASNLTTERRRVAGFANLPISTSLFERIESGDRAIEPLDGFPVHMGSTGTHQPVLDEPRFGRLRLALIDALQEGPERPSLSRALMQTDLWAAHDILAASRASDVSESRRREELLGLLARLIKKLSLTRSEIEALPDNFANAHLPFGLFAPGGEWVEVEYLPERIHDLSADFRRAARVFLKPTSAPADRQLWLNGLRQSQGQRPDSVAAVALVEQLLLVDADGFVVPSRLTYEVQVRTFAERGAARPTESKLMVAELSRKALLLDRQAGGLISHGEREPAYLPSAGNDYFFASPHMGMPGRDETILAPLRKRCESCHGEVVFTFSGHNPDPPIPVRALNSTENDRARDVARRKMLRTDYRDLKQRWDR